MSYNRLLDTEFKNKNWKFINCYYRNGYLISNNKVFGIEQELVLPDISKLYLRINYKTDNIAINTVTIGIQSNDVLISSIAKCKFKKSKSISVINKPKTEKIKIHVIFESLIDINKVYINNPLLIDLKMINRSTWLKSILDKTLSYRCGYSYTNLYNASEILFDSLDFKELNLESSKIGSIATINNTSKVTINAKFNKGDFYLVKLDFEDINDLGSVKFKYGESFSERFEEEQIFLLFKANEKDKLELILESNDIMDYKVNLKNIMIIDITNMKLLKGDIPYLPFI